MSGIVEFIKKIQRFGLEKFKRYYGIYPGVVKENDDPDQKGRVRVEVPSVIDTDGDPIPRWARPMFGGLTAGDSKGSYYVPEVGDHVWVMFRDGDVNHPNYIASGWFGDEGRPAEFESVEDRGFKTHSGHLVRFRDSSDEESVIFQHTQGHFIFLRDDGTILFDSDQGNSIQIDETQTITISNSEGTEIEMDGSEITASNSNGTEININGPEVTAESSSGDRINLSPSSIKVESNGNITLSSSRAVIDGGTIELGKGAVSPAVKGDVLMTWLAALTTWAGTHTHSSAGVPPNGPPPPPVPSMLSTTVRVK